MTRRKAQDGKAQDGKAQDESLTNFERKLLDGRKFDEQNLNEKSDESSTKIGWMSDGPRSQ
jgi:hypothetical protein